MADRHKNRTAESESIRQCAARQARADIGADLDAAFAKIDWERRRKAEGDLLAFATSYCTNPDPTAGAFLEIAPPESMVPIVRDMECAISDASLPFHIRIARGHGKTAYAKCAALWVAATGRRRYEVIVGANDGNACAIVEDVFGCITNSPAFIRDFPEIALPFIRLGGRYQAARLQANHGKPTKPRKAAQTIVFPTVDDPRTGKPFPSSGVILDAVGFNAGARGKAKGILRPDFLIFDDLQNDDRAQSEGMVGKMAAKVRTAFMGLAGHRKKIAAIMTSTPIEADDLSETFAADAGWKTRTFPMLLSWPTCHNPEATADERKIAGEDLWVRYWDLFCAEKAADRLPHVVANRFYQDNRAAMDAGAAVLNPDNFDAETELSGIQHAMNLLFRDGEKAFMAEYQMKPMREAFAFEISARLVMSRVRHGVPTKTIPPGTVLTVAATDLNPAYAITTAVVCFDVKQTAFVTAYHVTKIHIPENLNDTEFNARLFKALKEHAALIAAQGIRLDRWGIDAGGRQFPTVTAFAPTVKAELGIEAVPMLGRAGQTWNPMVRTRIRDERNATVPCRDAQGRRWTAWNADEYKEKMQRAWASETGAEGGISLFDGGNHYRFAVQVANEKLKAKAVVKSYDGKERFAYKWQTKNPHDFCDVLAMCYALAGAEGVNGEVQTNRGMGAKHKRRVYGG